MKTKITNLIKLLLNIHKALLDLEKVNYEHMNGPISSNQEYFNLVLNCEDFKWLRALSEIIAMIDEESEQENVDYKKIKELLINLKNLLTKDKDNEFSLRYDFALDSHRDIFNLNTELDLAIESIINN